MYSIYELTKESQEECSFQGAARRGVVHVQLGAMEGEIPISDNHGLRLDLDEQQMHAAEKRKKKKKKEIPSLEGQRRWKAGEREKRGELKGELFVCRSGGL